MSNASASDAVVATVRFYSEALAEVMKANAQLQVLLAKPKNDDSRLHVLVAAAARAAMFLQIEGENIKVEKELVLDVIEQLQKAIDNARPRPPEAG